MKTIILDIETDALENYTRLNVAVARELETDEVFVFRNVHEDQKDFVAFLSQCEKIIGHNLIHFDAPAIRFFTGYRIPDERLVDTLVIARLLNYGKKDGNSLEAWGDFFKVPKDLFNDFSCWSQQLEDRCIQDTLLTKRLYIFFKKYLEDPRWKLPVDIEHISSISCRNLKEYGFFYNISLGKSLENSLREKVSVLEKEMLEAFPPKSKLTKEINPTLTKKGTLHAKDFKWVGKNPDLSCFSEGAPFSLFTYEVFNPRSSKQRIDVLNKAGWRPTNKTKGHIALERELRFPRGLSKEDILKKKERLKEYLVYGWVVDEENLSTLPETAPMAARKLKEFILLSSRLDDIVEWNNLYNPVTGAIHGTFNHIGSWTHRKSHDAPNMANIPALKDRHGKTQPFGKEFRSLFCARPGKVLVGTDAAGIQLRLFAHFCNDEKLIKAIVDGKKEEKTDIHSLNMSILNTIYSNTGPLCAEREVAKTYIYALLLGAGLQKQAQILNCSTSLATSGLNAILQYYPGWARLKEEQIPRDAARGYFEGLDGRLVMFPSARNILAGYLQNGESVIMKHAQRAWMSKLDELGIPYNLVNDVHDEWQTEVDPNLADTVGKIQVEAIRTVGTLFNLNCPLDGEFKVGDNWAITH